MYKVSVSVSTGLGLGRLGLGLGKVGLGLGLGLGWTGLGLGPLLRSEYGLLWFGHVWGVVVNRGRNRRVCLVMRNLFWANVSECIGSGRLKKFLNMFKNKNEW